MTSGTGVGAASTGNEGAGGGAMGSETEGSEGADNEGAVGEAMGRETTRCEGVGNEATGGVFSAACMSRICCPSATAISSAVGLTDT